MANKNLTTNYLSRLSNANHDGVSQQICDRLRDFEQYPEEHCIKAPELLHEGGVGEEMIHAICSHGYGHVDVKPEHLMEKVLFTTDELTGLIWAAALMRPSKSVQDMVSTFRGTRRESER